jgi:hypothetical protein
MILIDVFRLTTVGLAGLTIWMVLTTWRAYSRRDVAGNGHPITRHIRRVTALGVCFPLYAAIDILTLLGEPLTWRAPTVLVIFVVAVWALTPLYDEEVGGPDEPFTDPFEGI